MSMVSKQDSLIACNIFIIIGLILSHWAFNNLFDYQYAGMSRLESISGSNITFTRSEHLTLIGSGGNNIQDIYKALGWMHAKDRYVQLCLMRLASQGRLTETFPFDEMNLKFDLLAKQFDFQSKSKSHIASYNPDGIALEVLTAYTEGINHYLETHNRPLEFVITNYYPEKFKPSDVTAFMAFVSFVGLNEICLGIEKTILEFINSESFSTVFLKDMFQPHLNNLTEHNIDIFKSIKHLKSNDGLRSAFIPSIVNSNNWVVSGALSSSGMPIMSGDPHLDVSKTPNTFYESSHILEDGRAFFGISVPGIPVLLMGRNNDVSFTLTYGMMDMADYFLENVTDGHYERDGELIPLQRREYLIAGRKVLFYETAEGHIIERYTEDYDKDIEDGIYLAINLPQQVNEVSFRQSFLPLSESVMHAQTMLPQSMLCSNYLLADTDGNIGYQQTGSIPLRPTGTGLLPLPAWDSRNLWTGFLSDSDYKRTLNPPENFLATANNWIQDPDKPCVSTYPALPTRINRITSLLKSSSNHSVEDMMRYQSDSFSSIADSVIPRLDPYLPKSGIGNELRNWNRVFKTESRPAALWFQFWELFVANVNKVFLGSENVDRMKNIVFSKYTFTKIALYGLEHGQVDGHDITPILKSSIETVLDRYEGLQYKDVTYYSSNNIFFSGKLPKFLGFDIGPHPVSSGLEVLKIGVVTEYYGAPCIFSQTWRFITDMSTNVFYSILPGGPSGNYFSNIYNREISNYLNEVYKYWEL